MEHTEHKIELGRCETCGEGRFVMTTGPGRMFLYRRGIRVAIPDNIPVPTCTHCGEQLMDEGLTHMVTEIGRAEVEQAARSAGTTR